MEFGVFDHLDRYGGSLADYYEDGTAAWRYEKGLSPEGEGGAP